jgi:hypothetical protein
MNALFNGKFGATSNNLSFGIIITVSAASWSFSKPCSALPSPLSVRPRTPEGSTR